MKIGIIAILTSSVAWSAQLEQCGDYVAEGYLNSNLKGSLYFTTDKDSLSQIRFRITDFAPGVKPSKWPQGVDGRVTIRIKTACSIECDAELIGSIEILDPFYGPKQFLVPGIKPKLALSCSK